MTLSRRMAALATIANRRICRRRCREPSADIQDLHMYLDPLLSLLHDMQAQRESRRVGLAMI